MLIRIALAFPTTRRPSGWWIWSKILRGVWVALGHTRQKPQRNKATIRPCDAKYASKNMELKWEGLVRTEVNSNFLMVILPAYNKNQPATDGQSSNRDALSSDCWDQSLSCILPTVISTLCCYLCICQFPGIQPHVLEGLHFCARVL
jgi:hypothetical protein